MPKNYIKIENSIKALQADFPDGRVTDMDSAEASLNQLYFHFGEFYGAVKDDVDKYHVHIGASYIDISLDNDHCKISALAKMEDGSIKAPIRFTAPACAEERYDCSPFICYFPVGAEVPYFGEEFAYKVGDEYKSLYLADSDLPWDKSKAKKMLGDSELHITERATHFTRDGNMVAGTVFSLPYKNEKCSIFRPTIISPVSYAINVDTDLAVEVLLTFEEGYMVPLVIRASTGGCFSIGVPDVMDDVLHVFDGPWDEIKEFLSTTGNYSNMDNGFTLLGITESGQTTTIEFCEDDTSQLSDLRRAVTSIRLIELNETIHHRKES